MSFAGATRSTLSTLPATPPGPARFLTSSHALVQPALDHAVAGTRTLAFLLLLLFLNLQGDGLHLGGATPLAFQLRLFPFTVLALALLLVTLFPDRLARRLPVSATQSFAGWRAPLAAAAGFFALAFPLLLAENRLFARFGYRLPLRLTLLVFLVGLALLATRLVLRRPPAARSLALLLGALVVAISILSIRSFPLAVGRSDMLPLLDAASHTLLHHTDPYRLYTFPSETVFLTYLPATLLAFLPATLLHLDPRLVNLASLLLLAAVLFVAVRPTHRLRATALLATFLLGPYLLYRHELYTPPHWLCLATALLLSNSGRVRAAAVLFGVSIAMSQFSWVLFPFFLLFLLQSRGARTAAQALALALLSTSTLILPFLLANPHAFLAGTFGHWGQIGLTARPINLSFFAAALVGPHHLALLQSAALLALFAIAVRKQACRTFHGTLRLMALALTSFVLLNLLVWGYFFLLIELLLLLYLLAAEDAFSAMASHS